MKKDFKDNDGTNLRIKVMENDRNFKETGWGYRHQQCLILFLCLTTAYTMRSSMGVALVVMVESKSNLAVDNIMNINNNTLLISNGTESDSFEDGGLLHSLLLIPPYPKFNWTKKTQDYIQSSFFVGYMLLQLPAGQLVHYFGARYLLSGALFINCVMSFCLPWAAFYGGWVLTSIFRIIQGLSQACIIPGMHTMFGKWTTKEERGRLAGLAYGGQALGTVLGLPLTGFVASSSLGWPGTFRFYGVLSCIFAVVLFTLAADSPAQHPKISEAERFYIENSIGQSGQDEKNKLKVPWGSILRSPGMYAIMAAHIGSNWGHLTLYSEVPAYMANIMKVDVKNNGVLTALPFLAMWFMNFFFSWLTDMLIVRKILSVRNTRKLANSLGSFPSALGLVVLAYAPKNIYVIESILIIICGFKVATYVGFQVNHIDISSNFSGTMMSISNFASNAVGCLAPVVAGIILTDVENEYLWRKVFFITAGFYFISNMIFITLGTAEKAEWDNPPEEDTPDVEELESMFTKKDVKHKEMQ